MGFGHDILVIVLGWAIPLILAWLLAKVPVVQHWIDRHQFAAGVALSVLISMLFSATSVIAYDRYFLSTRLDHLVKQVASINKALSFGDTVESKVATFNGSEDSPRCKAGYVMRGVRITYKDITNNPNGSIECVSLKPEPVQ